MSETEKTALEVAREKLDAEAKATNDSRSGKGTRIRVGSTRGKNPQAVSFEVFDESLPATLPLTLSEFMDVSKIQDEAVIVSMLIDGFNSQSYTAASDPVAEYINQEWPEDLRKQFRQVVRNYASGANVSIEDAVALIKPGIESAALKLKSEETK